MYELSATASVPGPLPPPQSSLSTGMGKAEGTETSRRPPAHALERAIVTPTVTTETTETTGTPTVAAAAAVPQANRGDADATTATTAIPATIAANVAGTTATTSTANPAPTGDARPRPVFKMKRTGHSGMFPGPFSPRNAAPAPKQQSPSESDGSSAGGGNAGGPAPSSALKRSFAAISMSDDGTETLDDAHAAPTGKRPPPVPSRPTPIPVISIPSSPDGRDETTSRDSPWAPPTASTSGQTPQPWASKVKNPRDVEQLFASALDNRPYKSWNDEHGTEYLTEGALIPDGYRPTDHPQCPWVCPVRSCRKMLTSLSGLGRHFSNSHRAAQFNDNLDGTLTDLGPYADPNSSGKHAGGFSMPCLVISQRPMTLDDSPMAEPSLPRNAMWSSHPTVPKRGGPRRRSAAAAAASPEPDEDDSDSVFGETESPREATAGDSGRVFDMANPDRLYNQWPNPSGRLLTTYGALLPDGYEHDTTLPDRPWICPLRLCRRLYGTALSLGNHFQVKHRGWRLNDNLDGTLSFLSQDSGIKHPVITSRMPMDSEEIVEPTRPIYPSINKKHIVWVKATSDDPFGTPAQTEMPVDAFGDPSAEPEPVDDEPELADGDIVGTITQTASGRPYEEWWDDSGGLGHMAGALIPDDYQNDDTYPGRPWICPIRSCRVACKFRKALGFHFRKSHRSVSLNDNGDGTLSIVGSHHAQSARVVSRKPLDPNEPPMAHPSLPLNSLDSVAADRHRRRSAFRGTTGRGSTASPVPARRTAQDITLSSAPETELWRELSVHINGPVTIPDIAELRLLLALPKMRDAVPARPLPATLSIKQIAGLLIQATGEDVPDGGCTGCRRNEGPFPSCVRLPIPVADDVAGLLRTTRRACGNCLLRKVHVTCSIKGHGDSYSQAARASSSRDAPRAHAPNNGAGSNGVVVVDDEGDTLMDDAALAVRLSVLGRRRSARISLAQAEQNGEDAEGEESDEAPRREKKKVVTLRVAPQVGRGGKAATPVIMQTRTPPSEADLRMEAWEMEGGRLEVGGEVLAFSNHHLTTAQTPIPLSPSITFHTVPLASGHSHTFPPAEAGWTRVCTVATAAGRLHVTVRPPVKAKGAQEEKFVVGAQGVFKLLPGRECTVVNRGYVDVVVQVVSAGGAEGRG